MDKNTTAVVAAVALAISAKLYLQHRRPGHDGAFRRSGGYESVSPLKHDMAKQLVVDLFPMLVYGMASEGPFLDTENIMGSKLTRMLMSVAGLFVFYELAEPYVLAKTPDV